MFKVGWEQNHFTQDWSSRYYELLQEAAALQNKLCEVVLFVEKLGNENETLFNLNMKIVEENKKLKNELDQLKKS
jgi:hypothetical protein